MRKRPGLRHLGFSMFSVREKKRFHFSRDFSSSSKNVIYIHSYIYICIYITGGGICSFPTCINQRAPMWVCLFSWGPCAGRANLKVRTPKAEAAEAVKYPFSPWFSSVVDEFLPHWYTDDHESNPRNPLQHPFYKPRSAEVGMSKDVDWTLLTWRDIFESHWQGDWGASWTRTKRMYKTPL